MANNLVRFDPFSDLARFEPLRGLDDVFRDFRLRPGLLSLEAEPRIRIDITESDASYTVKAEVPGVTKDDLKVSIEDNQVTISAESTQEKEEKNGERVVRRERYVGQQVRSFSLNHAIDDAKAVARYQNGILELTLPKRAGATGAKHLPIN